MLNSTAIVTTVQDIQDYVSLIFGTRCIGIRLKLFKLFLKSRIPLVQPAANPRPGSRQVRAGLRHAFDFFCRKLGCEPAASISTSRLMQQVRSRFVGSCACQRNVMQKKTRFKQVRSWLSTCFRHAVDVLSTRSRKSKARFAAGQNNGMRP